VKHDPNARREDPPVQFQPERLIPAWTIATRLRTAVLGVFISMLACVGVAHADAPQASVSASQLDGYIARVASNWESYTTPEGRVLDPLDPADTSDNYGVILLADVMLKIARRTGDGALEASGERILRAAVTLPVPEDPFNLFAIAAVVHDGRAGEFPASVWQEISEPLARRAGQIGFPSAYTCLTRPGCYDNWRLVWSAGAALLLGDGVPGAPGSLAFERATTATQIQGDLALALTHAGAPLQTPAPVKLPERGINHSLGTLTSNPPGGRARELSDPGAEPPAYELFSTFMLELLEEADPQAITPALARLGRQADRYALQMIAPDGQLSLSGRSLDQSWVQAAGAALGARRATREPAEAGVWHAFSNRAVSYLLASYPIGADGLLPIVPGLGLEWNRSIVDGYAATNQYEGLTLWLLSDALADWPRAQAPRAALPADERSQLGDDLDSSGLVWGRHDEVWWELSGRSTGGDPRSAQGLVAVKVRDASGWRDLLALRPREHGLSSTWTLTGAYGRTAVPIFTRVRADGGRVVLSGVYARKKGKPLAHVTWTLNTTATGIRLRMSMPAKATLHTTLWLPGPSSRELIASEAQRTHGTCIVSASGRACPVTLYWRNRRAAVLEIGS
jgi:hypothetical protein